MYRWNKKISRFPSPRLNLLSASLHYKFKLNSSLLCLFLGGKKKKEMEQFKVLSQERWKKYEVGLNRTKPRESAWCTPMCGLCPYGLECEMTLLREVYCRRRGCEEISPSLFFANWSERMSFSATPLFLFTIWRKLNVTVNILDQSFPIFLVNVFLAE